ncbi:hypothetical protein OH491_27185 [Termitidicoccus mucosus]|uniref:SbsA Ig-like domain-containing protein n=1 Tax=Termitidicoccus mucosus TaxID=1184151 RepID=A0A178IBG7_9BACT|nr:hypothetical protein AW736_23585 [Opitutaceae bacterium TSB47]
MKTPRITILALISALALATALQAKPIPGPKGGRIVTTEAPHVEFLVAENRAVTVSFYDAALKPVEPGSRVVTAVAEAKAGKVKLDLAPGKDGALVSTKPLPEGDGYTIVLQVRDNAAARPRNYRITYHDEVCGGCKRAEYACICEDAGGDGHKH